MNRIYIAHLAAGTTADDLHALLSPFGEVSDCVVRPGDPDNRNRACIGFATFTRESDAFKAIAALDGRAYREFWLQVRIARPRRLQCEQQ